MKPIFYGYLWCALAAIASAVASYLIKTSSANTTSKVLLGESTSDLLRLLYLACAVGAYGIGFVFYTLALKKTTNEFGLSCYDRIDDHASGDCWRIYFRGAA